MAYLAALIGGIFWVAFWPSLPTLKSLAFCFILIIPALCALRSLIPRACVVFTMFGIGVAYGVATGQQMLAMQLPLTLQGVDILVIGRVIDIPQVQGERQRFYFQVTAADDLRLPLPARLRLNWFGQSPALEPGQQWRLLVRLRRPRGSINPGGFDYQAWLLRQGVAATGYVRSDTRNRLLVEVAEFSVARLRYQISTAIEQLPYPETVRGMLKALTIGDGQQISAADWRLYSGLGIAHLLVISGLHIGLAAWLAHLLAILLARLLAIYFPAITAQYWGAIAAVAAAFGYSCLAGWGIPTQRAFCMVSVAALFLLTNRAQQKSLGYLLAMAVVALLDPLAVWSPGFWLSFGAVGVLLWLLPAHTAGRSRWYRWLYYPVAAQVVVSLGLLPLLLSLGLPVSPLMPLINLLAISWVSLLVVPLCLGGILVLPVIPWGAVVLWHLAAQQLTWFMAAMQYFDGLAPALDRALLAPGKQSLLVFTIGVAILLLPKGLLPRTAGLLLIVGACLHQPEKAPLRVTVLDVGQGLAVVVETARHSLVYDTGPFFSERFDAGAGIVLPFLRQRGIRRIDTLMVSHDDNDHAGGARSLLEMSDVGEVYTDPLSKLKLRFPSGDVRPCRQGVSWVWDQVQFQVLAPRHPYPTADNNRSCVLQIRYQTARVLLPGDIEAGAEAALLKEIAGGQDLSLLVAPHHGSKTSSSAAFVKLLQPEQVVFSSGYRHHFGHPHPVVVKRYRDSGATLWNTADSGALQFIWSRAGTLTIVPERERVRRFWFW